MARVSIAVACFSLLTVYVACQRLNNQGRLGSQGSFPIAGGPRGCFCLPNNQVCVPSGPVPVTAVRINVISTKILNTNPASSCPQGQVECCFGSGDIAPVIQPPQPAQLGGCGVSTSIKRGRPVTSEADLGEYPWMAAVLKSNNQYVAGGVLISQNWVLTAAHKVLQPGALKVRLGDYDLADPRESPHAEVNVIQVVYHPQFNPSNLQNDVALLRLARPVIFSQYILPACLPEQGQTFFGQRCFATGWGASEAGQNERILREVDLPIVEDNECENRFRQNTPLGERFVLNRESFLCAGGEEGKDACTGDGGSPLMCDEFGKKTVVGLVAWGIGCGDDQIPGAYVDVASYTNFIESTIGGSGFQ